MPKRASCPHSSLISYSSRPWAQGRPHRGGSFTFVYRGLERAYLAAAEGRFYQMDLERRWTEAFWIYWRLWIMTKTTRSCSSQPLHPHFAYPCASLDAIIYKILGVSWNNGVPCSWVMLSVNCQKAKIAKFSSLRTYIPVYHEVGYRGGNFIWTCERDDWKDMEGCWNHDSWTIKRVLAQTWTQMPVQILVEITLCP